MSLTRALEIDGRPLRIYDGLVPLAEVKRLTDAFLNANFVCDEIARPDTYSVRHWQLDIPLETARQLAVFQPTFGVLQDLPDRSHYRIQRVYCNHVAYGDMLFTHTDVKEGEQGLTALWYIAPEWDVEWGGETLLYNRDHDAVACVTPRPGRLAIFDGTILHAGRPPNRVCYAPRYTLAFKLEPPAS
ncbi:MAG: 2OG-Fe(II) oxygenase [Rhodanobacteraceae bacterium]